MGQHTDNLGTAYADLPEGDRAANLTMAIACYQAALASAPRPPSRPNGPKFRPTWG